MTLLIITEFGVQLGKLWPTPASSTYAFSVVAGSLMIQFLAPLIVTEAEIEQSVQRLEQACVALSGEQLKKAAG